MESSITIMPNGDDIEWEVSVNPIFTVLVTPDKRLSVCGTDENIELYARSLLAAVSAKKQAEKKLAEVINHG